MHLKQPRGIITEHDLITLDSDSSDEGADDGNGSNNIENAKQQSERISTLALNGSNNDIPCFVRQQHEPRVINEIGCVPSTDIIDSFGIKSSPSSKQSNEPIIGIHHKKEWIFRPKTRGTEKHAFWKRREQRQEKLLTEENLKENQITKTKEHLIVANAKPVSIENVDQCNKLKENGMKPIEELVSEPSTSAGLSESSFSSSQQTQDITTRTVASQSDLFLPAVIASAISKHQKTSANNHCNLTDSPVNLPTPPISATRTEEQQISSSEQNISKEVGTRTTMSEESSNLTMNILPQIPTQQQILPPNYRESNLMSNEASFSNPSTDRIGTKYNDLISDVVSEVLHNIANSAHSISKKMNNDLSPNSMTYSSKHQQRQENAITRRPAQRYIGIAAVANNSCNPQLTQNWPRIENNLQHNDLQNEHVQYQQNMFTIGQQQLQVKQWEQFMQWRQQQQQYFCNNTANPQTFPAVAVNNQQQCFTSPYQNANPLLINNNLNATNTPLILHDVWERKILQQIEPKILQMVDTRIRMLNTAIELRLTELNSEFAVKERNFFAVMEKKLNEETIQLHELQKKLNERIENRHGNIDLSGARIDNNDDGSGNNLQSNHQCACCTSNLGASTDKQSNDAVEQRMQQFEMLKQQSAIVPSSSNIISSAITRTNADDDVHFLDFIDRQKWLPQMIKDWEVKIEPSDEMHIPIETIDVEEGQATGFVQHRRVNVKTEPNEENQHSNKNGSPDAATVALEKDVQQMLMQRDGNHVDNEHRPVTPPSPPSKEPKRRLDSLQKKAQVKKLRITE